MANDGQHDGDDPHHTDDDGWHIDANGMRDVADALVSMKMTDHPFLHREEKDGILRA